MSDFDDFLSSGFSEASSVLGTVTLTAQNGESADVIADVPQVTKSLRETGLYEKAAQTLTIARDDFDTLALSDRQPVTLGTRRMRVVLIEDFDAAAPLVTVHLALAN